MNSLTISGRLTKDPEKAMTATGKLVSRISIACDGRRDKNGLASTFYLDCTAFQFTAEYMLKWLKKGDLVGITGTLQHETFRGRTGEEKAKWIVYINTIETLRRGEGKKEPVRTDDDELPGLDDPTPEVKVNASAKALEIDDDDMPF